MSQTESFEEKVARIKASYVANRDSLESMELDKMVDLFDKNEE